MEKCNHQPHVIAEHAFSGSVAAYPYTDENPAAHGNITQTQECTICGAHRSVNVNQQHEEFGAWGPTRAQRDAAERAAKLAAKSKRETECRKAAKEAGVEILSTNRNGTVNVSVRGGAYQVISLDQIRAAAEQHDDGDGLVPVYSGMLLMAEDALRQNASHIRPRL